MCECVRTADCPPPPGDKRRRARAYESERSLRDLGQESVGQRRLACGGAAGESSAGMPRDELRASDPVKEPYPLR